MEDAASGRYKVTENCIVSLQTLKRFCNRKPAIFFTGIYKNVTLIPIDGRVLGGEKRGGREEGNRDPFIDSSIERDKY